MRERNRLLNEYFPYRSQIVLAQLLDYVPATAAICHIEMAERNKGKYFDLQGREVNHPRKGIFIKDGKKVHF